jgi:peptidoglycan/xylan/chitin deacetylase (PgdA/CDA1 family)
MRNRVRVGVGAAVGAATAAHVLPAATWLPQVRRLTPRLRGIGRPGHVALTFDDGPSPASTEPLLELLDELGVRATFFVLGQRLVRHPELGAAIADAGHELAVHGWSHRYLLFRPFPAVVTELHLATQIVREVTGTSPAWFRPPYGVLTAGTLLAASRCHLRPVLWTAWGRDWRLTAPDQIAGNVLKDVGRAGTILLHESPVSGNRDAVLYVRAALPTIVAECRARHLEVGSLAEHGIPAEGRLPGLRVLSRRSTSQA